MPSKTPGSSKRRIFFFLSLIAGIIAAFAPFTVAFDPVVITSNSMVPALRVGDVVLTTKIEDFSAVRTGDDGDILVIANASAFIDQGVPAGLYDHLDPGTPIVHRAIDKRFENGSWFFTTKGDNNPHPDGCLRYASITNDSCFTLEYDASNPVAVPQRYMQGKVILAIPLVGYVKIYSTSILAYTVTLIAFTMLYTRTRRKPNHEKENTIALRAPGNQPCNEGNREKEPNARC